MVKESDFNIEKLSNGNFVIKTEGLYQDIDFVNGGFITTEARAEEIRNLLVEQANTPVVVPKTPEEKIAELKQQTAMQQMLLDDLLMNVIPAMMGGEM